MHVEIQNLPMNVQRHKTLLLDENYMKNSNLTVITILTCCLSMSNMDFTSLPLIIYCFGTSKRLQKFGLKGQWTWMFVNCDPFLFVNLNLAWLDTS